MSTRRIFRILIAAGAVALAGCRQDAPPAAHVAVTHTPGALPEGVVLPRYSEVVAETGKNLAYDLPAATIDSRLTEHSRGMAQRIYRTAGNVYCAVGYGLANMTMIEAASSLSTRSRRSRTRGRS